MAANWEGDVLKRIGAPDTPQNRKFLRNWQAQEGGWTHNDASYNPLNTTHGPGKSINKVGVKKFNDYNTGMDMTAQTILNGRYPNIVKGLRAGNPYQYDVSGDLSVWVSGSRNKGLSYAKRVTGGLQEPRQLVGPKSTGGRQPSPAMFNRKLAASAWIGVAMAYAKTGEVSSNEAAKVLGAVSHRGTVQPPSYGAASSKANSEVSRGVTDKILAAAHSQVGKPYVFGSGPSTDSFDCSDLIQWAYKQVGINIPRVTGDQIKVGTPVEWGQFKPGDLIFSNGGGHVVMYVGGGKVIAAPRTGTVVQYQPVSRFKKSFVGARRILE